MTSPWLQHRRVRNQGLVVNANPRTTSCEIYSSVPSNGLCERRIRQGEPDLPAGPFDPG